MAIDVADIPIVEEVGGYMTVRAVSRELGVVDQTVYYLLRSRQIKSVKLGGRGTANIWLVSKSSLERYKARRAARLAETTTE